MRTPSIVHIVSTATYLVMFETQPKNTTQSTLFLCFCAEYIYFFFCLSSDSMMKLPRSYVKPAKGGSRTSGVCVCVPWGSVVFAVVAVVVVVVPAPPGEGVWHELEGARVPALPADGLVGGVVARALQADAEASVQVALV